MTTSLIAQIPKGTRRRARRTLFRSDRPRRIDRYINFFGQPGHAVSPAVALRSRSRAEAYCVAS